MSAPPFFDDRSKAYARIWHNKGADGTCSSEREALGSAKIRIDNIGIAELHDCFTISEIMEYETFGLCEKGKRGKFIEEGQSQPL